MPTIPVSAHIVKLLSVLIPILSQVESGGNPHAIGDGGRAIGEYQIWKGYWADATRIMGVNWPYSDARNPAKARQAVIAYLAYYGAAYERQTGKPATLEVLARIHNGGPQGWKNPATRKYWRKVKAALPSGAGS